MKNRILLSCLCIGLLTFYLACEKDDGVIKEQTNHDEAQLLPTVKSITLSEAGPIFDRLKSNYSLDKHMQMQYGTLGKSTLDTLGVTIFTDEIKEVTLGDYTSYTMLMKFPEQDSTKFYNITMEEKNGIDGMFVTKYTPTQQWLQDKSTAFEGNISTYRVNEDIEAVDHDSGGSGATNNNDIGISSGSTTYPEDCDGIVIQTGTEQIPHNCPCPPDHTPEEINDCGCWKLPYVEYKPVFECIPDSGGFDETDYGQDNNPGPGGTTTQPDNDDGTSGSFTAMISEKECEEPIPGDLDANCSLDDYERCRLLGYSHEVCDCSRVSGNNTLENCLDDCDSDIESFNLYYSTLSPFNVNLANVRAGCDNIDISDVEANEKFMCIYKKLTNSPKFKNLFTDMFGENEDMNVTFNIVDNLTHQGQSINGLTGVTDGQIDGTTGDIINIDIIIKINGNLFSGTGARTPIQIAKTIIHECIHAFLMVKSLECEAGSELDEFNNTMLTDLLNYYYNFDNSCSSSPDQHEFMFSYMLPTMTDILSEIKDSIIPENQQDAIESIDFYTISQYIDGPLTESTPFSWSELYYYLCLSGLHQSEAYQNAIATDPVKVFLKDYYIYELNNLSKNCYD